MIHFTGDTHFGHANIIKFQGRPYSSVQEMDEDLIVRWNSVVCPEDEVYHLGDFALTSSRQTENIIRRLNGTIRLVRGNHDKVVKGRVMEMFDWVKDYYELDSPYGGPKIVLCHYAFEVWNKHHHGSWSIHGHSHGSLRFKNIKRLDVGVDTNDMYPYSIEQVAKIMEKRGVGTPDKH